MQAVAKGAAYQTGKPGTNGALSATVGSLNDNTGTIASQQALLHQGTCAAVGATSL